MASRSPVPASLSVAAAPLVTDLQTTFGSRLVSVVAHGPRIKPRDSAAPAAPPLATVAIVTSLDYRDLVSVAHFTGAWRRAGLAVPLILSTVDFERSLDAFPVEYGDIIAHHVTVFGDDPFVGLQVQPADLRRGCERWAKSHAIHLREGFMQAGGDARQVARLIIDSASPFAGLLGHVARLRGDADLAPEALSQATEGIADLPPTVVRDVLALEHDPRLDADTAMTLYPPYLDAVEKLVRFLDAWVA